MTTETIVAVLSAVLAVGGALWRAMAMLGALERKVDAVSAKIDLHVIDRIARAEAQLADVEAWRRTVERELAHMPRRAEDQA